MGAFFLKKIYFILLYNTVLVLKDMVSNGLPWWLKW